MRVLLINPLYPISETPLPPLGLAYGFHILAPFPGTEVREQADGLGIRSLTDDWSQYHASRAVVETVNAGRQQLNAVVSDGEKNTTSIWGIFRRTSRPGRLLLMRLVN